MKVNVATKCTSCNGVIPCGSKHCPYKSVKKNTKFKNKKAK